MSKRITKTKPPSKPTHATKPKAKSDYFRTTAEIVKGATKEK